MIKCTMIISNVSLLQFIFQKKRLFEQVYTTINHRNKLSIYYGDRRFQSSQVTANIQNNRYISINCYQNLLETVTGHFDTIQDLPELVILLTSHPDLDNILPFTQPVNRKSCSQPIKFQLLSLGNTNEELCDVLVTQIDLKYAPDFRPLQHNL